MAVEILPEDQWTAPSGIVLEDQEEQDPGRHRLFLSRRFISNSTFLFLEDHIDEEEIIKNSRKTNDRQPTGRISLQKLPIETLDNDRFLPSINRANRWNYPP